MIGGSTKLDAATAVAGLGRKRDTLSALWFRNQSVAHTNDEGPAVAVSLPGWGEADRVHRVVDRHSPGIFLVNIIRFPLPFSLSPLTCPSLLLRCRSRRSSCRTAHAW